MNGKIVIGVLSTIASSMIYQTRTASACGGFFCNQQPVTQTGEQIIFAVDEVNDTVQVDVQISYQGLAEDFAWLLPLPEAPLAVETGSSLAFLLKGPEALDSHARRASMLTGSACGECCPPVPHWSLRCGGRGNSMDSGTRGMARCLCRTAPRGAYYLEFGVAPAGCRV